MVFILKNQAEGRETHGGVLEFIAEEGRVYLPRWMMQTLLVGEGAYVHITSTSLPLGKFVKIQPQSVDFLDVSDPKAVLERAFRSFSSLTQGDIISISYNDKLYDILVMETKPGNKGISIIETDLEVDFAPPLGYVEPTRSSNHGRAIKTGLEEHIVKDRDGFAAFRGSGQRLSGKTEVKASYGAESTTNEIKSDSKIPPALVLPPGKLYFGYEVKPKKTAAEAAEKTKFEGQGASLRK